MSCPDHHLTLLATTNPCRDGPPQPFTENEVALCLRDNHAIVQVWEITILPALLDVINVMEIPMTHIDVIRLYRPSGLLSSTEQDDEAERAPVVVYVGARDEAASRKLAEAFVARCGDVLRSHGINEVFVEIHLSTVLSFSPPFLANDLVSSTRQYELGFQLCMGMDIAPINKPDARGTGCVFLHLRDRQGVFLLTCGHLLADQEREEKWLDSEIQGTEVTFLSPYAYRGRLQELDHARRTEEWLIQRNSNRTARDAAGRREKLAQQKAHTDQLGHLNRLLQRLSVDAWEKVENRVIGRVLCFPSQHRSAQQRSFAPSSSEQIDGLGFGEDWGLVELDTDSISPDDMTNHIPIEHILPLEWDSSTRKCYRFFDPAAEVFHGESLRVTGIAPLSDLHNREMRVFKRGAGTGETVGTVNPVRSVRRQIKGLDKDGKASAGFIDILAVTIIGRPEEPFARQGDSGAAVINQQGRAIAMVLGGPDNRLDLAYAMPIDSIFDQMRELYCLEPSLASDLASGSPSPLTTTSSSPPSPPTTTRTWLWTKIWGPTLRRSSVG